MVRFVAVGRVGTILCPAICSAILPKVERNEPRRAPPPMEARTEVSDVLLVEVKLWSEEPDAVAATKATLKQLRGGDLITIDGNSMFQTVFQAGQRNIRAM